VTHKTLYLVNPISGHGHLDAYARLYSRALVELGFNVVLLAPTDGGSGSYLQRNAGDSAERFSFHSFDDLDSALLDRLRSRSGGKSVLARLRSILRDEGYAGITRRVTYHAARLISKASPPLARALGFSRFLAQSRVSFASFPARMALAEELSGLRRDFVLFLYLDFMAEDDASLKALNGPIGPWAGILFHPRDQQRLSAGGAERYLLSSNAAGLMLLVPEAVERYTRALPAVGTVLVPDVADLETAGRDSAVAAAIRARANGRKVVLQIGTLTPHKGVQDLLKVIALADADRFFFAFVGRIYDDAFGEDAAAIRAFFDNPPENVILHDGFIEDEREYNSVIAAADIVFAVYRDFPSSSNILTKAAAFRVPLIVSNRFLMGKLATEYNLGIAVEESDPPAIHQALLSITATPWPAGGFERFAEDRSLERLKTVLRQALDAWH
jgi:glycosyltransferase involved in cell wall biosynthesis